MHVSPMGSCGKCGFAVGVVISEFRRWSDLGKVAFMWG